MVAISFPREIQSYVVTYKITSTSRCFSKIPTMKKSKIPAEHFWDPGSREIFAKSRPADLSILLTVPCLPPGISVFCSTIFRLGVSVGITWIFQRTAGMAWTFPSGDSEHKCKISTLGTPILEICGFSAIPNGFLLDTCSSTCV